MITVCSICQAESENVVPDVMPDGFPLLPCGHRDHPLTTCYKATVGQCDTCRRAVRWLAGERAPRCLNSREAQLERYDAPKREALRRHGVRRVARAIRLWMHWRRERFWNFCNGKVIEQ